MMTSTSEPLAPFEERLLAELKQELTARPPALRPAKTGSRRPQRVAVAAAAVGLGAAVAAGLTVATRTTPAGPPAPRYQLAADFLNRAAAAARAQNDPLPRPDQVSYAEQLTVVPGPHGDTRECTVLWSPSPLTGLNRRGGAASAVQGSRRCHRSWNSCSRRCIPATPTRR